MFIINLYMNRADNSSPCLLNALTKQFIRPRTWTDLMVQYNEAVKIILEVLRPGSL